MPLDIKYYTPRSNHIICEMVKVIISKGGMHIPEDAQKYEQLMQVVKAGDQVTVAQEGDYVIMGPSNAVTEFISGNRNLRQFAQEVVIGTYNPPN